MKKFRFFITTLLLMVMMHSKLLTISAHSNITYDCGDHVFIIDPGTEQAPTDLFVNFKDVMPGQTLTQEIWIRNDEKNTMDSVVYLRSLGAKEGSEEFLSQLKLTVSYMDDSEFFNAQASEPAQLSDWVRLERLQPGAYVKMFLTLEVPITLDNKFQDAIGILQWEFRSEEIPSPDEPEETITLPQTGGVSAPSTGDNTNIALYVGLALLSLGCIPALFGLHFSRGEKKNGTR